MSIVFHLAISVHLTWLRKSVYINVFVYDQDQHSLTVQYVCMYVLNTVFLCDYEKMYHFDSFPNHVW